MDFPAEVELQDAEEDEREVFRHLWIHTVQSRGEGALTLPDEQSSSVSSNEENEAEIMELFNHHHRKSLQNHCFGSPHPLMEFEVHEDGDVIEEKWVVIFIVAYIFCSSFQAHVD